VLSRSRIAARQPCARFVRDARLSAEDAKDVDSLYYLALSQRRRGKYNAAREGFLACSGWTRSTSMRASIWSRSRPARASTKKPTVTIKS